MRRLTTACSRAWHIVIDRAMPEMTGDPRCRQRRVSRSTAPSRTPVSALRQGGRLFKLGNIAGPIVIRSAPDDLQVCSSPRHYRAAAPAPIPADASALLTAAQPAAPNNAHKGDKWKAMRRQCVVTLVMLSVERRRVSRRLLVDRTLLFDSVDYHLDGNSAITRRLRHIPPGNRRCAIAHKSEQAHHPRQYSWANRPIRQYSADCWPQPPIPKRKCAENSGLNKAFVDNPLINCAHAAPARNRRRGVQS